MPWSSVLSRLGKKPKEEDRIRDEDLAHMRGDQLATPFQPGVRALGSINDYLAENIVEPLANRGYPNLGAGIATVPSVAAEMLIPQAAGDLAAMPFSKITKALNKIPTSAEKKMAKATGFVTPAEREIAMKRQNALQAVREVVSNKGRKNRGKIGEGIDFGAFQDPTGSVVVKGESLNQAKRWPWDQEYKEDLLNHAIATHGSETAGRMAAHKEIMEGRQKALEKAKTRFAFDDVLHNTRGTTPETFLVHTRKDAPYFVQDKADEILEKEEMAPLDKKNIQRDLIDRSAEYGPEDAHMGNIGRFGTHPYDTAADTSKGDGELFNQVVKKNIKSGNHPYKIIDTGYFSPIDFEYQEKIANYVKDMAKNPRYISPRRK